MDISLLRQIPLFEDLSDDELAHIAQLIHVKTYEKNKVILLEEDLGDTLFIISKGSVKISRINEDGKEVILSILSDGEFFGEMSILDGESRSANVVALEPSEVFMLKRSDFLDMLEKYPKISIHLLEELARRLRRSDQQIESLSLSDAEHRVANTLIRLAEDLGVHFKGSVTIEEIPLQQDIANMAGTSRETVSRMLKMLENKGLITRDGRKLIINNYLEFYRNFAT
ncbi:MAG: Crp/Fnr family transcriptional regulator [Candidatus Marinimicrobia bacterium]|nr:Crp/Fnr family transcriptional regulator [Candidatus Neomarinimicrobiota bacterium]